MLLEKRSVMWLVRPVHQALIVAGNLTAEKAHASLVVGHEVADGTDHLDAEVARLVDSTAALQHGYEYALVAHDAPITPLSRRSRMPRHS